jgi:hypothetical protein
MCSDTYDAPQSRLLAGPNRLYGHISATSLPEDGLLTSTTSLMVYLGKSVVMSYLAISRLPLGKMCSCGKDAIDGIVMYTKITVCGV